MLYLRASEARILRCALLYKIVLYCAAATQLLSGPGIGSGPGSAVATQHCHSVPLTGCRRVASKGRPVRLFQLVQPPVIAAARVALIFTAAARHRAYASDAARRARRRRRRCPLACAATEPLSATHSVCATQPLPLQPAVSEQ